jgi:hypothetical protein
LKTPDSDEENKIKQNKTKEIKAGFAWISFVWLGFASKKPKPGRPAARRRGETWWVSCWRRGAREQEEVVWPRCAGSTLFEESFLILNEILPDCARRRRKPRWQTTSRSSDLASARSFFSGYASLVRCDLPKFSLL